MIRAQLKNVKFVKPPHVEKKLRKVYSKRRQHVKGLINDLSSIAIQEINKLNELSDILLSEESDNPITYKEDEEDDEVSV